MTYLQSTYIEILEEAETTERERRRWERSPLLRLALSFC